MMKRSFLCIILLSAIILSGCGVGGEGGNTGGESQDMVSVVTTIFPPYDFTRQIAEEYADVRMLLTPGMESHAYEPTAADIITIQNSDVFIYIGGESDHWVDEVLAAIDTENITVLRLMDYIQAVEEEIVEGMESEGEAEEAEYDEHIWTSIPNAVKLVSAISDTLCEIDGDNAEGYRENAGAYMAALNGLDNRFREIVSGSARQVIVFGDRFPFRYFANEYGLTYYAAFPGCSHETEPSAAAMTYLIGKVLEEKIPAVFHAEYSNEKICGTISEETGAKILELHSCHTVSQADLDAGATYLGLMEQNAANLKEALN